MGEVHLIDFAKAMWVLHCQPDTDYNNSEVPAIYLRDTDKDGLLDLLISEIAFSVGRMSTGNEGIDIRYDAQRLPLKNTYMSYPS